MTGTDELVLAEVFGPTFQGEGPSLGRRASFVRFGGCNLHCGWCDTAYTWDASRFDLRAELTAWPVDKILTEVAGHNTTLTVLTGGEPLLHQHRPAWPTLLGGLAGEVEVETNGTVAPTAATAARVTRFNVSPKLTHAGDPASARHRPDALAALTATGRAVFKFVCQLPMDLNEVDAFVNRAGIPPHLVWVMAEGTTPGAVLHTTRALADPTIARGYHLTTRLHTLIWGEERGR